LTPNPTPNGRILVIFFPQIVAFAAAFGRERTVDAALHRNTGCPERLEKMTKK